VDRAIKAEYRDDPVEPGATITVGLLSAVCAGGVYAMLGVGAIAGAVIFLGASLWFGSLSLAGCWSLRRDDAPSVDLFTSAARKLESATKRLSVSPEKQLLQQFLDKAGRAFAIAEAATLQERILRGSEPLSDCENAQKTGIAIINKAAAKWRWVDGDSLKTAFNAGHLPSPKAYGAELFDENRALQEHIMQKTRSLKPNLPQRSLPPRVFPPACGFRGP
jgi:hypothetical protein